MPKLSAYTAMYIHVAIYKGTIHCKGYHHVNAAKGREIFWGYLVSSVDAKL